MQEVEVNKIYPQLTKAYQSKKRFCVQQGGTRSGKSYNILLWLIFWYCHKFNGRLITITRNTSPTLRNTIMRDFFEILENTGKYQERYHNKTNWEYKLFGNTVQFLAVDSGQKIRGGKRDVLFINEANEISLDAYRQLDFRTKEFIIMDYNPSEAYHWIYDLIIDDPDCAFHKTTYLDNPWLPEAQVKVIEKLMETDEAYWKIYGLGERAEVGNLVFPSHSTTDYIPPDADFVGYGMDFGYSVDPTALIKVYSRGDDLYFKEVFYRNKMSGDSICEMLMENEVDRHHIIYADQADPRLVDHIKGRGFNIIGVGKGRDSIRGGIDLLKRKKLYIHESSSNLVSEFRMYKWKEDRNGKATQDPIDGWNHGIDAIRYWALGALKRANYGRYKFA